MRLIALVTVLRLLAGMLVTGANSLGDGSMHTTRPVEVPLVVYQEEQGSGMSLTPEQLAANRAQIIQAAVESEQQTGLPAELTAAQCELESGNLEHAPGNNCFGIKVDAHGSGEQYVFTKEWVNGVYKTQKLAFETYDTLTDCFNDHARLITTQPVYAPAWEQYQQDHNLDALIDGIAKHYASEPDYAKIIKGMAHSPSLTNAVAAARMNTNTTDTTTP